MKFETAIGIGEVCVYNEGVNRSGRDMPELLVKVVAVTFEADNRLTYTVEHIGGAFGVQNFHCKSSDLTGDPEFNQDEGCYPPEDD